MMESTLDMDNVRRIEKSVDEAVTKINEVGDLVRAHGYVSVWPNPLPAIRDHLSEGVTTLKSLLTAHRSAVAGVETRETTLDQKENELREKERRLDIWEARLNERDEQLGIRSRDLDARSKDVLKEERSIAIREGNLETAEAAVEEKSKALSEKHDEQLIEATRLKVERDRLEADKNTAEEDLKTALDKVTDKLAKQSTTVDTISKKFSELDLDTVEQKLTDLEIHADKLLEEFAKVGSEIYGISVNARRATTVVEKLQSENVTKLNSALANITAKLYELLGTLGTSVREAEPHTSLSPASDKRKRAAQDQRALKRVAQGLEETPADGRPMSSESAEFGAPLPLSAKASEEARPVEPSSSSTVQGAQPIGASSSTAQVPRWINEDVDSEISVIWSKLEFFQPDIWTDADATKFKALLKRFQLKGGSDRPVSKFATCSSQQQNGRETCYECKSASKGNGNFDQGNNNACQICRAQRKPCFRVTRTGDDESKWLVTLRNQGD